MAEPVECSECNGSGRLKRKRCWKCEGDGYLFPNQGFYATRDGLQIHVQGDPNMSEETLNALFDLAKLAQQAEENDATVQ